MGEEGTAQFFSLSPFDSIRFAELTEGLEVSVVAARTLERTRRIDAEYFQGAFTRTENALAHIPGSPLTDLVQVSDGNHFAITDAYTDEGVPYFRGQDVSGTFFADPDRAMAITTQAYERPYMKRSHLRRGDVLLSIIGTIGSTALVDFDTAATCSCKLAILRPKVVAPEYLAAFLACGHGQRRIEQLTRGAVQRGLLLEDMDQLRVPTLALVEEAVVRLVRSARQVATSSATALAQAEAGLLDTLGLRDWTPPEPLTYTGSASAVMMAGRWDSQFHAPAVLDLRAVLAQHFDLMTLGELGDVTNGRTVSYTEGGSVPIIRSGDVGKRREPAELLHADAAQPIYRVQRNDVLISSIGFGSIGRVEAVTTDIAQGTVSEVTVVRQGRLDAHYVTAFLRSFAGQRQLERYITGATGQLHLYPRDVREVFIPVVDDDAQRRQRHWAEQAAQCRSRSVALLTAAKRAVEIAIEHSEAAALAFIAEQEAANASPN